MSHIVRWVGCPECGGRLWANEHPYARWCTSKTCDFDERKEVIR